MACFEKQADQEMNKIIQSQTSKSKLSINSCSPYYGRIGNFLLLLGREDSGFSLKKWSLLKKGIGNITFHHYWSTHVLLFVCFTHLNLFYQHSLHFQGNISLMKCIQQSLCTVCVCVWGICLKPWMNLTSCCINNRAWYYCLVRRN